MWFFLYIYLLICFLYVIQGLYYAALFLFHNGKFDKAREYIDRMLKMQVTKEVCSSLDLIFHFRYLLETDFLPLCFF